MTEEKVEYNANQLTMKISDTNIFSVTKIFSPTQAFCWKDGDMYQLWTSITTNEGEWRKILDWEEACEQYSVSKEIPFKE
jgi:hypothetical protein